MNHITPDGTLSHPHLFHPQMPPNPKPDTKPRYQTVLLFKKEMTEPQRALLLALKTAALNALKEKWGDRVEAMLADETLKWPFRKKWTDKLGQQKYDPEMWQCYINPWSHEAPGIVSRVRGLDGKPTKITDQKLIFPGAVCRLSVNPFIYQAQGNWGVAFGLQNVQKVADGPRLDNRLSAQDTFDADEDGHIDMEAGPSMAGATDTGSPPPPLDPGKQEAKLADLFN